MAGAIELGGAGQARRPGAHNCHAFAGAFGRRLGYDPTLGKALIDDGALDTLDRHRRLVNAEHAGALARRRTDAAGELGEIVGLVQTFQRLAPEAAVNQVIPFRDQVVDGTAGGHPLDEGARVAEGDAAVHAACALILQHGLVCVLVEFEPVVNARSRIPGERQLAGEFQESSRLAHDYEYAPQQSRQLPISTLNPHRREESLARPDPSRLP